MTIVDILLLATVCACAVAIFAAGYSWALIRELNQLQKTNIRIGGESDVCTDENWSPFGPLEG